jgi:uncharacterized protein YunC (DUF1805 family)
MRMDEIESHVIGLENANLVLIKARRGYLMCGLLNVEAAERLDQAACTVSGVKTPEEALKAKVKAATKKAKSLGVREGMTGEEALRLMR